MSGDNNSELDDCRQETGVAMPGPDNRQPDGRTTTDDWRQETVAAAPVTGDKDVSATQTEKKQAVFRFDLWSLDIVNEATSHDEGDLTTCSNQLARFIVENNGSAAGECLVSVHIIFENESNDYPSPIGAIRRWKKKIANGEKERGQVRFERPLPVGKFSTLFFIHAFDGKVDNEKHKYNSTGRILKCNDHTG